MPLTNYTGLAANNPDLLRALVGERITGVFEDAGHLVLVAESGAALVLTSIGGKAGPAYWVEDAGAWRVRLTSRQKALKRLRDELDALHAIDGLPVDAA